MTQHDDRETRLFSADQELEEMLQDAEETVARLRAELAARREAAMRHTPSGGASLAEQHAEIDRLAEHLAEAKVHWGAVREFFEQALREFSQSRRQRGEQP